VNSRTPIRKGSALAAVAAVIAVGVSMLAGPAAVAAEAEAQPAAIAAEAVETPDQGGAADPDATADGTDPDESTGPTEVAGGNLIWGVSQRWRDYITGRIAHGEIRALSPATAGSDGWVTWVEGAGEVDLSAGTGAIEYRGGFNARGHYGAFEEGEYALDQTLSSIRITLTSTTTATLSAEAYQPDSGGYTVWNGERLDIASLTFDEGDLLDGEVTARAVFAEGGERLYGTVDGSGNVSPTGGFMVGDAMDDVTFGIGAEVSKPDPLTPTSVALKASKPTVFEGDSVTLTATVSPAVAGTFSFRSGTTPIGDPMSAKNGAAAVKTTGLPRGDNSITAVFTPKDAAAYASSTSAAAVVAVLEKDTSGSGGSGSGSGVEGSLQWGVKESFRSYVVGGIAHGKITASKGASQASGNGAFTFPQASAGTTWSAKTGTGVVQYAGQVRFTGHDGVMDVTLANPSIRITGASTAELRAPSGTNGSIVTFATIDLSDGVTQKLDGGAVRYRGASATLTSQGAAFFSYQGSSFYEVRQALDRVTFTIGDGSDVETQKPSSGGSSSGGGSDASETAKPAAAAAPAEGGAAAGSLRWGISSAFVAYTTCDGKERFGYSHCAKGSVTTSGVGSGYLFPQAAGGEWDEDTQTGSVRYSGIVSFQGYGMTMFSVSNPVITVTGPSSATLSIGNSGGFGAASYPLDLSSATKTEGAGGSVTWSGVSVRGSLSGGPGGDSGHAIGFDDLTFTVGAANSAAFGSTSDGEDDAVYTAAATAPATTGVDVLTDADRIRAGGRIQLEAAGFDAGDTGVLVVLYGTGEGADAGPIVLDDAATAGEDGTVSWSGTLPDDVVGEHVITVQGSAVAGAEIAILEQENRVAAQAAGDVPGAAETATALGGSADPVPVNDAIALWEWWVIAGSLVAIAACTSMLAVRQRRAVAAA